MPGVWLFNLIDSAGVKLYTFKLTENSTSVPDVASPYESPSTQYIYGPGTFTLEITYAYNGVIPTVTTLGIYSQNLALTDPAAGKFYTRFTTADRAIFASQLGTVDNTSNYNSIAAGATSDIVYTFSLSQVAHDGFYINCFPLDGATGNLNYQTHSTAVLLPVQLPALSITGPTNIKATTYYINRLLNLGYTMTQIVPYSLYTDYREITLTFPSYELRQLFMDGNSVLNRCRCDTGRVYN